MLSNNKISVCLYINSNFKNVLFNLKQLLKIKEIKEIICIVNKNYPEYNSLQDIFSNNKILKHFIIEKDDDLLSKISSKYVFISDSNNSLLINNLKDIPIFLNKYNPDILLSNYDIKYKDINYHGKQFDLSNSKNFFEFNKYIFNIYDVNYLKNNHIELPITLKSFDVLQFYFKTIFGTSKILKYNKNIFYERIFEKNDLYELVNTNFDLISFFDTNTSYDFNAKNLYENLVCLFDYFISNDLYDEYKFHLLNYIFDLLLNIFNQKNKNDLEFFVYLKKFINFLNLTHYNDLILNLKTNNLLFYKQILSSNTLEEIKRGFMINDLSFKNEELKFENDKIINISKPFIFARFDIKNMGKPNNSVEILENSDKYALINYPKWFTNNDGKGLILESKNRNISLKIKCNGDGILRVTLRGIDKKSNKNNRIPIYINYEHLSVDNKVIFNNEKLISHDSPYIFEKNVKNGEVIHIQSIWKPFEEYESYYTNLNKNNLNKNLINKFITCRFDIKNFGNPNNNIKIINIDDNNTEIKNPSWFKNNKGTGITFESDKKTINFKLKCINSGKLNLTIRGIDFKDSQNLRIPIMLILTKLIINGKNIITTDKLIFHDQPYVYTKDVVDGEILTIHAKWKQIEKKDLEIFNNKKLDFKPKKISAKNIPSINIFKTGRFDIKNIGDMSNFIELKENSDKQASVSCPSWFNNKTGKGTVIESSKGEINLKIKCHGNGNLNFRLRGIDFKDSQNIRIPILIDFTHLTINNKTIFDKKVIVHHDQPYVYTKDVVDGEILTIHAKWKQIDYNSINDNNNNLLTLKNKTFLFLKKIKSKIGNFR